MNTVRQYTGQDWAVQRWDRLHEGRHVEPRSFCQFWRGVLLWATLASIPIVGKMFLAHLQVVPSLSVRLVEQEAFDRRVGQVKAVVTPFGRVVWALLWPVRQMVYWIGRGAVTVVSYLEDTLSGRTLPKWTQYLWYTWAALIVLTGVGLGTFLLVRLLIAAWQASWPIFLLAGFGIPVMVASLTWVLWRYGPVWFGVFVNVIEMLWDIAIVSKHRVCPPITIVRTKYE